MSLVEEEDLELDAVHGGYGAAARTGPWGVGRRRGIGQGRGRWADDKLDDTGRERRGLRGEEVFGLFGDFWGRQKDAQFVFWISEFPETQCGELDLVSWA
jgi:hypothetical protein